jgi:hypothetical protein
METISSSSSSGLLASKKSSQCQTQDKCKKNEKELVFAKRAADTMRRNSDLVSEKVKSLFHRFL